MRYIPIDTISFTDSNGRTVNIKDMREYEDQQTLKIIKTKKNDKIDEIASRQDIYGNDGEIESYRIVDYNIVKLHDVEFDMAKIETLEIPTL